MSLESWKRQFYPRERVGAIGAIEHSIRKWEGLRPENLKAHKLSKMIGSHDITDELLMARGDEIHWTDSFNIDSDTCALCIRHDDECRRCELAIARDGLDCFHSNEEETISPFHAWSQYADPEPMIFWLVKTRVDLIGR